MFLTLEKSTKQFECYKSSLSKEVTVRIIKEDVLCYDSKFASCSDKIGFFMVKISEYFFGMLFKEHYREVHIDA